MVSSKGFQGLGLSSWVFRVRGYAVREFGVLDTGIRFAVRGSEGSGFRVRCYMVRGKVFAVQGS